MDRNVDLFADVAAALFRRLQAAFPIPVDIEIDQLADAGMPEADPIGATREAFVEASIHWLGAAGIVTFEAGQMGARMIERVGLTASGFLSLQSGHGGDDTIGAALDREPAPAERRSLVTQALAAAGRTFRSVRPER